MGRMLRSPEPLRREGVGATSTSVLEQFLVSAPPHPPTMLVKEWDSSSRPSRHITRGDCRGRGDPELRSKPLVDRQTGFEDACIRKVPGLLVGRSSVPADVAEFHSAFEPGYRGLVGALEEGCTAVPLVRNVVGLLAVKEQIDHPRLRHVVVRRVRRPVPTGDCARGWGGYANGGVQMGSR